MSRRPIRKVLVANRGEIACRIIRACRELGISSVAVYAPPDISALHVHMADEAYPLQGSTPTGAYLRGDMILDVAMRSGADAIHPGYGFLSENADFVGMVENAGLTFVGPSSSAIRKLGDKTAARRLAEKAGVPVVPGTSEPVMDAQSVLKVAEKIGYPLLLKASAGGGGKGMRVVERPEDVKEAMRAARSEAKTAFGDDRVYVEKLVQRPRHIEIQILADTHGNVIHLGERECSIQRRHQKVVEESPSPALTPDLRNAMGDAAVRLAKAGGYSNAGTVEFMVGEDGAFFFLEVNARLQVEHPVTELANSVDIVHEQLRIAAGEVLSLRQEDIRPRGWSIECRICAEDPEDNFIPSSGILNRYTLPSGPFVRVENGFRRGDGVSIYFDSLLAKVIVWAPDRKTAILRMRRALAECEIEGIRHNVAFCQFVMHDEAFCRGSFDTHFVREHFKPTAGSPADGEDAGVQALIAVLLNRRLSETKRIVLVQDHGLNGKEGGWVQRRTENFR